MRILKCSELMIPAVLALSAGCVMPSAIEVEKTKITVVPAKSSYTNAVCNPLDSAGPAISSRSGLLGHLWYAAEGQRDLDHVKDYQAKGTALDATLFFNQLNVPTRRFDLGFSTRDGKLLKTPSGDTLYEYFALHFDSVVKLSTHDRPGRYQFALLADDGAVLRVNDEGHGFRTLVNDDGRHPTRMACASEGLDFDAGTRLPIKIDYFQGPRYHIALMLMWRRMPEGHECYRKHHHDDDDVRDDDSQGDEGRNRDDRSDDAQAEDRQVANGQRGDENGNDQGGEEAHDRDGDGDGHDDRALTSCGVQGNEAFFDWTQTPSRPQHRFAEMLAEGWQVVAPENYELPADAAGNPCTDPSPSPSVTPAPSPSVTPAPSPSVTPAPSPSVTPAPSPSVTPAPSPSVTPTPSPSVTPTPPPVIS